MKRLIFFLVLISSLPLASPCQDIEKVVFDPMDTADGYYLAVRPASSNIKGVLVVCTSFSTSEWLLPETKLHNVAFANDLLTVFVTLKQKLYADTPTAERFKNVLQHVVKTYNADKSKVVVAGYDLAGTAILRFAELTRQHPVQFDVKPAAVFVVGSPVDLFSLWRWCERQVARKSRSAWDANFLMELMTKELGSVTSEMSRYQQLTPFFAAQDSRGNERYLNGIPIRLYYDVDPEWLLKERQSSLYDTYLPEGTELVARLRASGNKEAELIMAKQPGKSSRGVRSTNALSIVDEVECIHWIKNTLNIFDPNTTIPTYSLFTPPGWTEERFPIPIDFAPQIRQKGVEDVRFAPGWGDPKSEDYWSYAFLWWLEGIQKFDAATFQVYLKDYYNGLVTRNVRERNIPIDKVIPTEVKIKSIPAAEGDKGTFEGSVSMLDYMTQQPIILNYRIHVKACTDEEHTAVFIELSPKPYDQSIWKVMNKISRRLNCDR